jgi:hypothetical protein
MGFVFPNPGSPGSNGGAGPDNTTTGVFGHAPQGSDAVDYSVTATIGGGVSLISTGAGTSLANLKTAVIAEYNRRTPSTASGSFTSPINHGEINQLLDAIKVTPYSLGTTGYNDRFGYQTRTSYKDTSNTIQYFSQATAQSVSGPSFYSTGDKIYAADINNLISAINSAGAVCLCNCNYCTCNCNYCTCNCNYACTCNCNYGSDIRLKENIKFIKVENNLNIYSWNYIKDKSTRYRGVMAQELIGTRYESALGKDKNGYFYVNYSQLPVTFKEA